MLEKPYNSKIVTAKLERRDICNLMLACSLIDSASDENTKKWAKLHDKIKAILDDFDSKNFKD